MNKKLYYISAIIKSIIGLIISIFTFTSINVYEDTAIAIILGFIGIFILSRGVSFFVFLRGQRLRSKKDEEKEIKESYKLSLLFGIYCMVNILLLLGGYRSKLWGIIILIGFIALQIFLIKGNNE